MNLVPKFLTVNPLRALASRLTTRYRNSDMEQKLLNIVLGFGAVLSLLSAVNDTYLGTGLVIVSAELITCLFLAFLYYLSNVKKQYRLSVFLLIAAAFYLLVPVIWIFNGGTLGSTLTFVVLFSGMAVTLCKGLGRIAAVGSLLLVTGSLMWIEYIHPEWIVGYDGNLARFKDIFVTSTMVAFANALLFIAVLHEYKAERANLVKSRNELLHLSYHDALTGIGNRNFFEAELKAAKYSSGGGAAVFVLDIDGLKFINDTFGHARGDQLLLQAVRVLKDSFGDSDVICRIGGDEFAVLLHGITVNDVEAAYKRVQNCLQNENSSQPADEIPLRISVGYAYSAETGIAIEELFRKADNKMYRKKTSLHVGGKGSIVHTIQQILSVRDVGTGEHVERAKQLIVDFAREIGMAESEMADLQLFAEFHDVGKVGVPDRILNKPGPLTADERAEMEKHVEIGFRIAQSSQELRPIAQWILEHHEWWDGAGYPLGISRETIPLACRLLAIVDAYDAMMSDRPYRSALSKLQSMDELLRCAGSQFDPVLAQQFVSFIGERDY